MKEILATVPTETIDKYMVLPVPYELANCELGLHQIKTVCPKLLVDDYDITYTINMKYLATYRGLKEFAETDEFKHEMTQKEKISLFIDILRTLQFLANHGIYHADTHSGNFMISPSHRPIVIDFGLMEIIDAPPPRYSHLETNVIRKTFTKLRNIFQGDIIDRDTYHGIQESLGPEQRSGAESPAGTRQNFATIIARLEAYSLRL